MLEALRAQDLAPLIRFVEATPAGRDAIDGWRDGILHVRVAAPPAENGANEALLRLLAKSLAVPRSSLSIASGAHARTKIIAVEGLTATEITARTGG